MTKHYKSDCQCFFCCRKRGEDVFKKFPKSLPDIERIKKWQRENPEKAHMLGTNTMNKLHKQRPELFEGINQRNSIRMKEFHKEWKAKDYDGYYRHFKDMSKKAKEMVPNHSMKGGFSTNRLHPNQCYENAEKSIKTRKENRAYFWNNVGFLSKEELTCAKILLKEPIDGVNCNIKIGRKQIDFYPQKEDLKFQGYFIEYHPCPQLQFGDNRTAEQYYQDRKQIIENSQYKGTELILITSAKDIRRLKDYE